MLLHATCVALTNRAILITGDSGTGKSDLALRLVDSGAELVADDQTMLARRDGTLFASAPDSIRGLIEIRHVGLMRLPFMASAEVALYVTLMKDDSVIDRLPEKDYMTLLDTRVRHLRLPGFAASTPAKIRAFLKYQEAS